MTLSIEKQIDYALRAERDALRGMYETANTVARQVAEAAESRVTALSAEVERLRAPITMQDVRLAVGEGKLRPIDILNGANAELRRRALTGGDNAR